MDRPALPDTPAAQNTVELFGSFHLGEFELALPIDALQEVVTFPGTIVKIPHAPEHVLGLFNLRGMLIPIVHLGRFLGLPDSADNSEARIALVISGQARLGLLFDRTGEMLKLATSEVVPLRHDSESLVLIESAFLLDDRILQVLSASALSRLPGLPQLLNPDVLQQARQRRITHGNRHKAISFQSGGRRMAVPMKAIQEIIRLPKLKHSVLGNERCLGWLELRGRPVPVVDFACFLGLKSHSAEPTNAEDGEDPRRVLVLRKGDAYLGLLVDNVGSIVAYLDTQLLPMPTIQGEVGLFAGCISCPDSGMDDLLMVNVPALLTIPFITDIIQGHHDLYLVADSEQREVENRRQRIRETWITFRLDRLMGLRIEQLREVVDYDATLLRPPGAPPYVRGVLNLRQALIMVVDLRIHYSMDEAENLANSKILIVEHCGHKYGLVVDALENIVSIDTTDKLRMPLLVTNQLNTHLQHDLLEFIELSDNTTAMLMDSRPLMARLANEGSTPFPRTVELRP